MDKLEPSDLVYIVLHQLGRVELHISVHRALAEQLVVVVILVLAGLAQTLQ